MAFALGLVSGKGRARLLRELSDFPGRDFTVNGLAKAAGAPFATAWRAVRDWENAGLVHTRILGKARAVRLSNPAYAALLLKAVLLPSMQQSALESVRTRLAAQRGVKKAFLFGSVAEGVEIPNSDLDVALLVEKERDLAPLVNQIFDETGCKAVFLQFTSESKYSSFARGKKTVELK